MSVSIIGTRGCGKSTFIGLLHQGMEMYTNKNPDNFVYYVTAEVGDKILDIRNNLLQGEYPAATTRHQLEQLRFLMGFKPVGVEKIVNLVKNFSSFGQYGDYLGMILSVYDIAGEDIQEFKINKQVTQILKQVFESNILVIIVDCAKFTNATSGRKYVDMLEYDKELAVIIAAYVEYRSKGKFKEKVNPIFVFAKMDALDTEIANNYFDKLERKYDVDYNYETGNELMESYLSASRAAVYGAQKVGVPLETAKFFYSWVQEDKIEGVAQAGAQHKLKITKPDGGHTRNVFPDHMYEEFLNYIRTLSYMYSDPTDHVEDIFGKVGKT
ncbi:MAG: hypothetical protein KAS16_08030 [Thermoplasmata archaeon]|nr:hypothetical protein [Thermoplasmata archaeon]